MHKDWSRRQILRQLLAAGGVLLVGPKRASAQDATAATPRDRQIRLVSISPHTIRLTILPLSHGQATTGPDDGSLVKAYWGEPVATFRGAWRSQDIGAGKLQVRASSQPLSFEIATAAGKHIQRIDVNESTGVVSFETGDSPLLGLGEGGPQFDRRGSVDRMVSGQGGYQLRTHGGRVPIPWIISTSGWAMFFHQPFGTFDFTGPRSKFQAASPDQALDFFFIASPDPATIMAEYARLTGHAQLPPLWSLGYQQSHRTLASREEVLSEARTFREKKLPCDALIYLGTGFCPSGWNTENGSFAWNSRVFPDPREMLAELHRDNFKAALHVVILSDRLRGTVHDPCGLTRLDEEEASCYWDAHRKDFAMGVDGWWPDEGDPLDIPSRLARNRMYWDGPQIDRPNQRPYALHRNGYAGMQRYASFLWSGDVYSTWETLKTHIAVAINTGLSGIPYWGTDIGGFVPTPEFTAELYLRWFQFGAFCTLFRSHGRAWKLRLPWGWNTGEVGPTEIGHYDGAALPDPSQLHNPQVEPICRKYLELRYRMLPSIYSAVHECATTGMPIMRALWLHFPNDPKAVACTDQYMWGKNLLVAPVVAKGATTRGVYLPPGSWYDFWTNERTEGGHEITRPVDLETLPLYVRAGAILPLGPVKQYVAEKTEASLSLTVYPGADGSFLLYEDDGESFNYRSGEWMGIHMEWNDARRVMTLRLAEGSRLLPPSPRHLEIKVAGGTVRSAIFNGRPAEFEF